MHQFLTNLKLKLITEHKTQSELAEKIGVSINTIRGWFAKDVLPDVFIATKIAECLSTTVEELVYGSSNNKDVTPKEIEYLKKYRALKSANKDVVITFIDALYEQEKKTKENLKND